MRRGAHDERRRRLALNDELVDARLARSHFIRLRRSVLRRATADDVDHDRVLIDREASSLGELVEQGASSTHERLTDAIFVGPRPLTRKQETSARRTAPLHDLGRRLDQPTPIALPPFAAHSREAAQDRIGIAHHSIS
jgi:hypothetical protein